MNAQKIWDFLIAKIGNPYGVAGLMGNLYAESGLNPDNLQNSFEKKLGYTDATYTAAVDDGKYHDFVHDGAGYGLAQWTYWSRKQRLLFMARERHTSIGNMDTQLECLWTELQANSAVLNVLKTAKSVREASDIVLTKFERPANQSDAVKEKRAAYGQKYYDQFADTGNMQEENYMATNYKKYILSTGTHYISNSGSDENGAYRGGKAGDQTGKEWQLRSWYKRPWTHVLRYPDQNVGTLIAQLSIDAALNDKIGYDQGQRDTYWKQLKKVGYYPAKITIACEEDCTAGVNANVHAAGYLLGIKALQDIPASGIRSTNMRKNFKAAGFKVLTDSKYLTSGKYLLPGDILLYENHHAAANVTVGKNVRSSYTYHDVIANPDAYRPSPAPTPTPSHLGDRVLKYGDEGADVMELQQDLMKLGYALQKYGADGDFGNETESAVKHFQQDHGLPEDGIMDDMDYAALFDALDSDKYVEVTGDKLNVRSGPGLSYKDIGTVYKGDKLPYKGQTVCTDGRDWYLIEYKGKNGWVSSKYSELV